MTDNPFTAINAKLDRIEQEISEMRETKTRSNIYVSRRELAKELRVCLRSVINYENRYGFTKYAFGQIVFYNREEVYDKLQKQVV